MIRATMRDDGHTISLSLKGHSGTAPAGEDLVCAVATGYAYCLAQNLRDRRAAFKSAPKFRFDEGDITIRCRPKDEYHAAIRSIFGVIVTGYRLLEENYPEAVKFNAIIPERG